jgi:hypothetical protein
VRESANRGIHKSHNCNRGVIGETNIGKPDDPITGREVQSV